MVIVSRGSPVCLFFITQGYHEFPKNIWEMEFDGGTKYSLLKVLNWRPQRKLQCCCESFREGKNVFLAIRREMEIITQLFWKTSSR